MEKPKSLTNSPRESIIIIKLLDIFPSINELMLQQQELNIIFQGLDKFYNLYELLENKTELTIDIKNKTSINISLIKSNNIFASCFYNIKQGEQWLTFSYENKKKKEISFAKSLIDCIKIKLICNVSKNKEMKNIQNNELFLNRKKLHYNSNNKNHYLKQNSNYSSLTTEDNNNRINKKLIPNKKIINNSVECSPKEKFSEIEKYSNIKFECLYNNKSNKDMNIVKKLKPKNSYDQFAKVELNLTKKLKKKNESYNNLDTFKKNIKMNKQIIKNKLLDYCTFNNELNISKNTKNKNSCKNKNNKNHDNTESLCVSSSILGYSTNRNNKGMKNEFNKDNNSNILKKLKTPIISKNNKFQNEHNLLKEKENNPKPKYIHNEQSSSSIIQSESNDIYRNENEPNSYNKNESNNFEKLKEDFILLYNDNYVKNVQQDLLKLEIELFVEKMSGLICAYHNEVKEKKMMNNILEKYLENNSNNFFRLKKLNYKLKLIKKKYKQNNTCLCEKKANIKLINDKEFKTNKREINLFNLLYPFKNDIDKIKKDNSKINKKDELKKILNAILSKPNNKNILSNNILYKKFVQKDINNNNHIKEYKNKEKNKRKYFIPKARKKIIPKSQQTKYNAKTININNNTVNEQINVNININSNLDYEEKIMNSSEYNIKSGIFYNKPIFISNIYNTNKTYSRKIPK